MRCVHSIRNSAYRFHGLVYELLLYLVLYYTSVQHNRTASANLLLSVKGSRELSACTRIFLSVVTRRSRVETARAIARGSRRAQRSIPYTTAYRAQLISTHAGAQQKRSHLVQPMYTQVRRTHMDRPLLAQTRLNTGITSLHTILLIISINSMPQAGEGNHHPRKERTADRELLPGAQQEGCSYRRQRQQGSRRRRKGVSSIK